MEDLYKGYYLALHMRHLNTFKLRQLICNNSEDVEIACKGHERLVVSRKGRLWEGKGMKNKCPF